MVRTTRRRFLGSGVALAGALAGCTGGSNSTPSEGGSGTTATATSTPTPTATDTAYTVEMAPMGEVTFDAEPEGWVSYFSTYGDMGIALGRGADLRGMFVTDNYPTQFYDELGLDVPIDEVPQLMADSVDKEVFYAADADVHFIDPNMLTNWFDWSEADVAEVAENVGPFLGNMIRRRGDDWHDYRYYTLFEAFEKVAATFRERERYQQWATLHDEVLDRVQERLPANGERPEVALLSVNSDFEKGSFWGYTFDESNGKKQYADLGVRDAFADLDVTGSFELDYERLLEIDPDALMFHFGVSHSIESEFAAKMDVLRDDPVGGELAAVQNDRLFRGGTPYQGPIINLFQTELAAQQLYPDAFGDELFDRDRVADVVTGN